MKLHTAKFGEVFEFRGTSMTLDAPQLPRWLTVGFTGHRALVNAAITEGAIKKTLNRLALIHPRLAGVSSAAYGADSIFAQEMLRRECPLQVILPFPCGRFKQDFCGDHSADWSVSMDIIQRATVVKVVYASTLEEQIDFGSASENAETFFPTEMTERPSEKVKSDPYMDAGYQTIDAADVVVAVWDGQPSRGWGGTAYTVKYARETHKPLIIIDPATGEEINERMDQLNAHVRRLAKDKIDEPIADPNANPIEQVDHFFKHANSQAKKHGPLSRLLVRIALWLFLAASATGYAGLVFHPPSRIENIFTAASFAFVAGGIVILIIHARRHDEWLRHRVNAEVCRSFRATWEIRKYQPHRHEPRPALPGLEDLFARLRLLRCIDFKRKMGSTPSLESVRVKYGADRVDSQIKYFVKHANIARQSVRRRRLLVKVFGATTVICSLTVFLLPGRLETTEKVLHFVADTLPLAATALGISMMTQESVRRAVRYQEMLNDLLPLQRRLAASDTWDSLARVATEVEEVLLQELLEWRSFIRFTRDIAHPE